MYILYQRFKETAIFVTLYKKEGKKVIKDIKFICHQRNVVASVAKYNISTRYSHMRLYMEIDLCVHKYQENIYGDIFKKLWQHV